MRYIALLISFLLMMNVAHAESTCPAVAELANAQITSSVNEHLSDKSPMYNVFGQLITKEKVWNVSASVWARNEENAMDIVRDSFNGGVVITFMNAEAGACNYSMPIQGIWFVGETTIVLS